MFFNKNIDLKKRLNNLEEFVTGLNSTIYSLKNTVQILEEKLLSAYYSTKILETRFIIIGSWGDCERSAAQKEGFIIKGVCPSKEKEIWVKEPVKDEIVKS